jgi:hypothetical protein
MTEEEQVLGRIYKTVTPAVTPNLQSGVAKNVVPEPKNQAASVVSSAAPLGSGAQTSTSKNASVWMVLVTFAIIAIPTISVWIAVFARQR